MGLVNKIKSFFKTKERVIDYFEALREFDENNGAYIPEFYLEFEEDFFNYWGDEWSDERIEKYRKNIEVFARADGTGGQYAFWFIDENNRDRNNSPIICYGSEGNMNIVASNMKDFIQMLSCGEEGLDGGFSLCYPSHTTEKEFRENFINNYPFFYEFRDWMQEELKIEPIQDWWIEGCFDVVEKLQKKANDEYKDKYETFNRNFFPGYYEYFDEKREQEDKEKLDNLKKEEVLLEKIATEPQIQDYLDLINIEYRKDVTDHQKQIEYADEVFKLDPNNKEVKVDLINIYQYRLKNYEKALELLLELAKEYPDEAEYSDIGNCYRELQQYDKAIEYFEKEMLRDYNENKGKKNSYESDLMQKWIVDTAEEANLDPVVIFEDIITRIQSAKTFEFLMHLTFRKKEYKKSVDYFIKERELSRDQQGFRYTEYLEKLFDNEVYTEGIRAAEFSLKHIQKDDRLDEAYSYAGLFYMRVEPNSVTNLQQAITYHEKAIKLDPEEDVHKTNLEVAKKKLKKVRNAL